MSRRLGRSFFRGPTLEVARRLLGTRLVHRVDGRRLEGRIVEVEAYLARDDPASHSRMGPTARNASMFLAPGHAYVYRIYGLHRCFNVVTAAQGVGEAVLVRALEPLRGLEEMAGRRGREDPRHLCSGPGRLVQALGLGDEHDGLDLTGGDLVLLPPEPGWILPPVRSGPRIGIRVGTELPLRLWLAGSPWTSRP